MHALRPFDERVYARYYANPGSSYDTKDISVNMLRHKMSEQEIPAEIINHIVICKMTDIKLSLFSIFFRQNEVLHRERVDFIRCLNFRLKWS